MIIGLERWGLIPLHHKTDIIFLFLFFENQQTSFFNIVEHKIGYDLYELQTNHQSI